MPKKKIAICHYRVGGNDGVSLEIKKRKQILERYGCEVKLIAGSLSEGADHTIKELEWTNDILPTIKENSFLHFNRYDLTDNEIKRRMKKIARKIEKQLTTIQRREKFDVVLVHNVFSLGEHTAAAEAFAKWIDKFKIPTIATHHDFYWERQRFRLPRTKYLKAYMKKYMPPKSPHIRHVVISSLAQKELKKRCGIESVVIPDVFDFEHEPWKKDKFNRDFLKKIDIKKNDLLVLQATRIMPRKGVEIAIEFVRELQEHTPELRGKKIYNGKRLGKEANTVLVVVGATEQEDTIYSLVVKAKAFEKKVNVRFASEHIRSKRVLLEGTKRYSLWDAYAYADLITYPSIWEGWGNQFIEAVFAKKPIVVFEYPVFKKDIKPEGYRVISLGSSIIREKAESGLCQIAPAKLHTVAKQTIKWLLDKDLYKKLNKNFAIGRQYHDYRVLEDFLMEALDLHQQT